MKKRIISELSIMTKNSHKPFFFHSFVCSVWRGILCLLLAGTTACVVEDVEPDILDPDIPVPVKFQTTMLQTRAGDVSGWATGDRVGIFMLTAGGFFTSDMYADNREYVPSVTGNAQTTLAPVTSPVDQTVYYPVNGSVDFVAYCPYKPASEIGGGYVYPVDVSNQAAPAAIDLRYAKNTNASKNSSSVTLTFDHQLSRVTIHVTKGQSLIDDFTGLTAAIHGVPSGADFSLESRILTPHSPAPAPIPLRKTVADDGVDATFDAIFIPQTGTAGRKITLHAGTNVYTWDIPADIAFEAGKQHIYALTVNKATVNAEGSIVPWTDTKGQDGTLSPEPLPAGTLLLDGYTGPVTITYKDGSTATLATVTTKKETALPAGSGNKIIKNIILTKDNPSKTPILIGRKGNGKIELKVSPPSYTFLRGDVNSKRPIGSIAEFERIRTRIYASPQYSYLQEADIDMMDIPFEPLGVENKNPFMDVYDGGNYKIRNLTVSGQDNAGLFGYATGANTVIRNVHIVSGNITGKFVGSICGYLLSGATVENCSNRASVKGTEDSGGIVGYNRWGKVVGCYNAGAITSTGEAGGITGSNVSENGTSASVVACYNTGNITSSSNVAGGITGINSGTCSITACYSIGNVSGSKSGGICGNASNAPVNCYWAGNATAAVGTGSAGTTSRRFGDGSNSTGWPANSAAGNWGIASGSNGGTNGYYWKSLGSYAWNTYPQLWWEN
ncbi:MAG: fimbrillin family protein [Tannerella sp.]|jgi:hypothetical protein|nr:fimbrillin family protein [Tannerella sp.]